MLCIYLLPISIHLLHHERIPPEFSFLPLCLSFLWSRSRSCLHRNSCTPRCPGLCMVSFDLGVFLPNSICILLMTSWLCLTCRLLCPCRCKSVFVSSVSVRSDLSEIVPPDCCSNVKLCCLLWCHGRCRNVIGNLLLLLFQRARREWSLGGPWCRLRDPLL
jgi:hypothetical protein